MNAALDDLLSEAALHRLVQTYSRAVDRRDFALLRSLYDDAAQDHHGHQFEGGPAAYVAFVEQAISTYQTTSHYVLNCLFQIEGDHAEGEIHKLNHHLTLQGDEVITGSRSLDRYIRRDGVWRFLSRRIVLDWSRQQPARAATDPGANTPPGTHGADDPSYSLPLMPPFGATWRG